MTHPLSVGEIESTACFLQTISMLATCLSSLKTITSTTHVQKIYNFNPVTEFQLRWWLNLRVGDNTFHCTTALHCLLHPEKTQLLHSGLTEKEQHTNACSSLCSFTKKDLGHNVRWNYQQQWSMMGDFELLAAWTNNTAFNWNLRSIESRSQGNINP